MKDFRPSKKWLLIIFSISISAILVANGFNEQVFANQEENLEKDTRAILLTFTGNGGGHPDWGPLSTFMNKNEGTNHDSAWNKFHFPSDGAGINWLPFGLGDCPDLFHDPPGNCNWSKAKSDAKNYINANPLKKIVIAGYSFGGGASTFLGYDLSQSNRQVEGIFLTDPVGPGLLGNSRTGIMQICNTGGNSPIDLLCTRSSVRDCANHKDSAGNPFKLAQNSAVICGNDIQCPSGTSLNGLGTECVVKPTGDFDTNTCPFGMVKNAVNECGPPLGLFCPSPFKLVGGIATCGKDVIRGTADRCPSGTSFSAFGTGVCVVKLPSNRICPAGMVDNGVFECGPPAFGSCPSPFKLVGGLATCGKDVIRGTADRCPSGTSFSAFGTGVCVVKLPSNGICPAGMKDNLVFECGPNKTFTCSDFGPFRNLGLFGTICGAQKFCPSDTSFNLPETACVVKPTNGPFTNSCPFGMEEIGINECGATAKPTPGPSTSHREMNSNIKGIFVSYQIQDFIPTDNAIPWHFSEWASHISGVYRSFLHTCSDASGCHGQIADAVPLQAEFINHLRSLNAKPSISITSGTNYNIMEGQSGALEIQTVSNDDTGVGETIGNMRLFPRLDSLNNGVEPSSQIDNGAIDGNTVQKHATFLIDFSDEDGPDTRTRTVWVEDNGWPCDDCTVTSDSMDGGATGKWNHADFTVTIMNAPPTPVIDVLTNELSDRHISIKISATDPSNADTQAGFTYEVDWGDGTTDSITERTNSPQTLEHDLVKTGITTVTVTAEDKDGGVGQTSHDFNLPDVDGDGIVDNIDTLPTGSSDFNDSPCIDGVLDPDTGTCTLDTSCPADTVFNTGTGLCESMTTGFCPSGTIFNSGTNLCEIQSNPGPIDCANHGPFKFVGGAIVCGKDIIPAVSRSCPSGTSFNLLQTLCTLQPPCPSGTVEFLGECTTVGTCPSGFKIVGGAVTCGKDVISGQAASCPSDTSFNFLQTACVVKPTNGPGTNSCPFGMVESAINECGPTLSTFTCPSGFDLNPSTNLCEVHPANCTAGLVLNSGTNLCEADVICPENTNYNPQTDFCEVMFTGCPSGFVLNSGTNLCDADLTPCPAGSVLNSITNLCEVSSCPDGMDLNSSTNQCEDFPTCPTGSIFNPSTERCESSLTCPSGSDFNTSTNLCEALACPSSHPLNPVTNKCEGTPGTTDGTLVDSGDQDISILEEQNSDGIFFNANEGGGDTPATIIACDKAGELKIDSGDSGNITCGSITVSIVSGSVDVQFNTSIGPATTTLGTADSLTFDGTITFTNNSLTDVVIKIAGRTFTIAPGETLTIRFPSSSTSYQDPNLGDVRHGQGHDNGFCMNQNCINVDGFFNHFPETIVPQGSTQTFSLLINCPRGTNTCNHASIEGVLPDSDFYDEQWGVTLDRIPGSNTWETTINNQYGEIGEVTTTVQEVGQSFLSVSFNVEFLIPGSIGTADGIRVAHENNRFLHVTVWDSNRGLSNYIFNEGVYVDDIYAFPKADSSYEKSLEVERLCLNENSNKRYTCAFDKVKQWTIKNAEKQLDEINKANGHVIIKEDPTEEVESASILKLSGTSVPATIPLHEGYYKGERVYYIITDSSDSTYTDIISKNQGWKVKTATRLVNVPDGALSKTFMFTNGVPGDGVHGFQGEVFTSTPAHTNAYSALTSHVQVTWDDASTPIILDSEKAIMHVAKKGLVTLSSLDVVLNMPQIVWPEGQMSVKVDKTLTDTTPYVGGQVLDIDLDDKTVTFIAHKGLGIDGRDVYYIVTDATPIGPANMMGVTYTPAIAALLVNSAPVEMYQFMNGIQGHGPMGFQAGIVNSAPGDSNYSPMMRVFMVEWDEPSSASLVENIEDIDAYLQDGLISVKLARPMYEHLIVNAPFIDPFQ